MRQSRRFLAISLFVSSFLLSLLVGCQQNPLKPQPPPLSAVPSLDLDAYLGDWYVIAHSPGIRDRDAYNAWQRYALAEDGTILVDYHFRRGSFDAEPTRLSGRALVTQPRSRSEWRITYTWPVTEGYWVIYVDEGYTRAVVGSPDRDVFMVLSRSPSMPAEELSDFAKLLQERNYDVSRLRRVPQNWNR